MGPRSNSDSRSNVYFFTRMARHKYLQEIFTLIEVVIVFLVIAFLLASTLPYCAPANARRRLYL